MSTKSGTNAFHGQGVHDAPRRARREQLLEQRAGIPKREFRVNDAGGSIGGPILRNKLFFFSSYHGLRNNQNTTQLLTVPTALERVGNFSQTFIRDENGNPVPHLRPVQRRPGRSRSLPPRRDPERDHPNPDPFALRMYASTRCRTARRTTSTTRTTSRPRR